MQFIIDTKDFNLDPIAYHKAISRTLNESTSSAKTEMSKAVRAYYNVKAKDVNSKMTVKRATVQSGQAVIKVVSKPIGLIHFGATASKAKDKGSKRYFKTKAKVLRAGRKKLVKGAFIAQAKKSGTWQVFRRTSKKGLPIIKLAVHGVTTMVEKKALGIAESTVQYKFKHSFIRNYKFYLSK